MDDKGDDYDVLERVGDNSAEECELTTTWFHMYGRSPTTCLDDRT